MRRRIRGVGREMGVVLWLMNETRGYLNRLEDWYRCIINVSVSFVAKSNMKFHSDTHSE